MADDMSATAARSVANKGAGLAVSAKKMTASELRSIAACLKKSAILTVEDSATLSAPEMRGIAGMAKAPASVSFI